MQSLYKVGGPERALAALNYLLLEPLRAKSSSTGARNMKRALVHADARGFKLTTKLRRCNLQVTSDLLQQHSINAVNEEK